MGKTWRGPRTRWLLAGGTALVLSVSGCAADVADSAPATRTETTTAASSVPEFSGSWQYQAASFAGNGSPGSTGNSGAASDARLWQPRALARAADGTVYIADTWNNAVRSVSPTGTITLVAGDGSACVGAAPVQTCGDGRPAPLAQLYRPSGLALAPDETTLYVADTGANRIRAVRLSDSTLTTVAGTGQIGFGGDGGSAVQAMLAGPLDVAVDASGSLHIADTDNNRIRKVDSSGVITTEAGTSAQCLPSSGCGVGGPAAQAQLSEPSGVTVSTSGFTAGQLLIADTNSNTIRSVDADGKFGTVVGTGAAGAGPDGTPPSSAQLSRPNRVSVAPDGSLVISDTGNQRLLVADPDATETWSATIGGQSMPEPWTALADSTGLIYADATANVVSSLTAPTGPQFSYTGCGPDGYTHPGPTGRMTDTLYLLPGTTGVRAQAWGAAGGASSSGGGGTGGYAATTAPVDSGTDQLAVAIGCTGTAGSNANEDTRYSIYGAGGGATLLAELNGYLANEPESAAIVVAGGGGGSSAGQGNGGGNGAGQTGGSGSDTSPGGDGRAGGGSDQTGRGMNISLPGPGNYGFGGPGGDSGATTGGWGPQWCPTCVTVSGAGGSDQEANNAGGGGGAGGGARGTVYTQGNGGAGGGSWAKCQNSQTTQNLSTGDGSLIVTPAPAPATCQSGAFDPAPIAQVRVPSVAGRTVQAATTLLQAAGLKVSIAGGGTGGKLPFVFFQLPLAGSIVDQGTDVTLYPIGN